MLVTYEKEIDRMRPMRGVQFGRRSLGLLGPLLVALVVAASAGALPTYEIVALGLLDAEHTRNDGYQESYSRQGGRRK